MEDSFLPSAPAVDDGQGQQTGLLSLEDVGRRHILKTLKHTDWVVEGPKGAALILELHPNTLCGRMRKLSISGEFRQLTQVKAEVVCTNCRIDEVRKTQPNSAAKLYQLSHNDGQVVIEVTGLKEEHHSPV